MGLYGYAMTEHDATLAAMLEGAARHLALCGRNGCWNQSCDRLSDRLGRYGLGRN